MKNVMFFNKDIIKSIFIINYNNLRFLIILILLKFLLNLLEKRVF